MNPEEFKAIRRKLGLTQKRFAEEIGVGERHVQRIEAGHRSISIPLQRLVKIIHQNSKLKGPNK